MPGIFTKPIGGIWPLGLLTVAAAGTPTKLNTNIGAQSQAQGSQKFSSRIKQVVVNTLPGNTKNIYVLWFNAQSQTSKAAGTYVIDSIPPGASRSYPAGSLLITSSINIDNWGLDADVNGEGAYCFAIYG